MTLSEFIASWMVYTFSKTLGIVVDADDFSGRTLPSYLRAYCIYLCVCVFERMGTIIATLSLYVCGDFYF